MNKKNKQIKPKAGKSSTKPATPTADKKMTILECKFGRERV
jgi:hypothetical protein